MKIIPTILCGGSGTRLWPTSRTFAPKQLQSLIGEKSLLANTVLRLQAHAECTSPVLLCGQSYADEIEAQMIEEGASLSAIIAEPMGRDTAAAAAIAAHWGQKVQENDSGEDYVVLLLPADHHISDIPGFHSALTHAGKAALGGYISTIGITPHTPETGFGYINRANERLEGLDSYPVAQFVEKPDEETAKAYLASGDYLWNSGMFAFQPETFLHELVRHDRDIADRAAFAFSEATLGKSNSGISRVSLNPVSFKAIPKNSIDFAVMEHTDKASVFPTEFGWNDVGSWSAAHEIADADENGNVLDGDIIAVETSNSLVRTHDKLIAVVGLKDMVVIDTADAMLICPKDKVQKVKAVHKHLSDLDHPAAHHHGPGSTAYINQSKARARAWLFDKALPFWTDVGVDHERGGVYEAVDLSGRPLETLPKRVRVQARQVYVFSHAKMLGYSGAENAISQPLQFLLKYGQRDDGGFHHVLAPDGAVIDDTVDTYDHAFVLMSLAWAYKATGNTELKSVAEGVMDFIETKLAHPVLGFEEGYPAPTGLRRANPHMHLLEAAMAWMKLHQNERMANLASRIVNLFKTNLCVDGLLREYFDGNLATIPENCTELERAVEPGHLYEWAYLLRLHEKLSGVKTPQSATLEAFADAYGINPLTGLVMDHVKVDGSLMDAPTSRLWPQTEYIRLKLQSGTTHGLDSALSMLDLLTDNYLRFDGITPGYWRDQLSADGQNLVEKSPASSFYHILGCLEPLV
ncbi:MAG: mannose-1-phosphate guanylyltransferase/mannose-6-phosphate isomerase [Ponticaulis sp.]|nr:mannose-1-phosphate guanylyltransferase/mannose-6-phosphate isomerase [Ponticaulis sp.]|tara:strand:+ start:6012 stop:8255 length:2244 start_codon:yes stop_codon:yes gene_type:complete